MEEIMRSAVVVSTTNVGAGVVRDKDGMVVFVRGAVMGDVVDVCVEKRRSRFSEGRILEIKRPSPYRIAPDCAAFSDGCGGCTFRHVTYEHELSVKSDYIRSAMKKCGLGVLPKPFLTAGENAVRSKATLHVDGYYAHGTHTPVACARCLLHDAETDDVRAAIRDARVRCVSRVTIRRALEGTMLILRAARGTLPEDVRDAVRACESYPYIVSIWLDADGVYTHIAGARAVYDTLACCRFRISPDSFYQVNHDGAELLYGCAAKAADLRDGERVADLYCGTGTIGIAAVKAAMAAKTANAASAAKIELFGVEINADAVRDAEENARINGVDARFIRADAAEYEWDCAPDCVIVDPPRAGCGERLISRLSALSPKRIVYVSCEPATLARDAALLCRAGYDVKSLTPVDMFPRTGKVECVCLLGRGEAE